MLTGGPAVDDKPARGRRRGRSEATPDAVTPCRFAPARRRSFGRSKPIDQSVLTQNRALIDAINRRGVLRGAISLGALTLLTGCDVTEEEPVQKALRAVSAWNDRVQEAIFRPDHLAPTFPRRAGGQAAALQRLLRHRGRQAGRRRDLEAGAGRPHRRQAAVDRAADLCSCRSRRSSSATSASKAGITSANGPARTCGAFCSASAPT